MRLKPRSPIAEASAGPADSFPTPDTRALARRRLIAFVGIGIAAYVLGLIATLPASLAFPNRPWRSGVAGTLWNGEVGIAGGTAVKWHWAPLRSITSLGFAVDWHATGPDTDLGGRALAGWGSVTIDKASGSANARLLDVLGANLPFTCDFTEQVEMEKMVIGGSGQMLQGQVVSDPGTCRPRGAGAASAVPAMVLTAQKIGGETRIKVAPARQRMKVLVHAMLPESGPLEISVTPEGATMLPFLGMRAGGKASIEL